MDGLPTGWESDYDGTRWLYRYAPTGRIQFTFPKPGDEFPQFDAPGAGRIALTPEDQLAYELQLNWQKEGMHSQGSMIPRKGKAVRRTTISAPRQLQAISTRADLCISQKAWMMAS